MTLLAKPIKDSQPRVPTYTAITTTKRNFLTADDPVLRFVPYFGQAVNMVGGQKGLLRDLEEAFSDLDISKRDAELANQISGHLDSWLAELSHLHLTEQILQRFMLQQGRIKKNPKVSRLILKSLGGPLPGELSRIADYFETAFHRVFDLSLDEVLLPESHLKELARKLKPPAEPVPSGHRLFTNFADFLCLVCGIAYCQIHGDYNHNSVYHLDESGSKGEENELEDEYDYQPLGTSYPDLVRKHKMRISNAEPENAFGSGQAQVPCSETCYLANIDDVYDPWPRETGNSLKEFLVICTDPIDQSCNISWALDKPCWQVHREIRKSRKSIVANDERVAPKGAGPWDRPQWYNNEKKTLHSQWEDMTKAHIHEERTQLDPVGAFFSIMFCLLTMPPVCTRRSLHEKYLLLLR